MITTPTTPSQDVFLGPSEPSSKELQHVPDQAERADLLQGLSEQWLNLAPSPSQWPIAPLKVPSRAGNSSPALSGATPQSPDVQDCLGAPQHPKDFYARALGRLDQGDQLSFEADLIDAMPRLNEESCVLFDECVRQETSPQKVAAAYMFLSMCYLRPNDQLRPLRFAVGFAPELAGAHGLLAQTYTKLGRYFEAQQSVNCALGILPQSSFGKTAQARIYLGQLDVSSAFEILSNPSAADRRYVHFNVAFGITLLHRKNVHNALFHFHEAKRLDDRYADVHAGLATALLMRRKVVEAVECYEKARACPDITPCMTEAFASRLFDEGFLSDALRLYTHS